MAVPRRRRATAGRMVAAAAAVSVAAVAAIGRAVAWAPSCSRAAPGSCSSSSSSLAAFQRALRPLGVPAVVRPRVPRASAEPAAAESVEAATATGAGADAAPGRFADLMISAETKRAIAEDPELDEMTPVQAQAIPPIMRGQDVIVRSKTGTGKTLAFLIPIVEAIRCMPPQQGGQIRALIMEPTRELTAQTTAAAKQLLKHHRGHGVFSMMGTNKIYEEMEMLNSDPCDILVATPGRLHDHLRATPGFYEQLKDLQILVLDEADRLLNDFHRAVEDILADLPVTSGRQGLFFSATFPSDVSYIASIALRPDYKTIDIVAPDEQVTPDQIDQTYTVVPMDHMAQALWKVIHQELASLPDNAKIIVFFTTARVTQYYAEVFRRAGMNVLEMHSRRSQNKRFTAADGFWTTEKGILFSTDVSARGMDYPDVTTVIHFGAPSSADWYVHRLGRSGRMGKIGRSIMLLHDFESGFLEKVAIAGPKLPMTEVAPPDIFDDPPPEALKDPLEDYAVGQAYKAWLGYYRFRLDGLGWTKEDLVMQATRFAASIGALGPDGLPPAVKRSQVRKMQLLDVEGLNVQEALPYLENQRYQKAMLENRQADEEVLRQQREEELEASGVVQFTGELGALFAEWDEEARASGKPPLLPPKGFDAPRRSTSRKEHRRDRDRRDRVRHGRGRGDRGGAAQGPPADQRPRRQRAGDFDGRPLPQPAGDFDGRPLPQLTGDFDEQLRQPQPTGDFEGRPRPQPTGDFDGRPRPQPTGDFDGRPRPQPTGDLDEPSSQQPQPAGDADSSWRQPPRSTRRFDGPPRAPAEDRAARFRQAPLWEEEGEPQPGPPYDEDRQQSGPRGQRPPYEGRRQQWGPRGQQPPYEGRRKWGQRYRRPDEDGPRRGPRGQQRWMQPPLPPEDDPQDLQDARLAALEAINKGRQ